jgi:hypothetical protein
MFMQHCFGLHREFLQTQGQPLFVEHIVFSDGYSSQFKCGRSLFNVAHYLSLTKCDELGTWNLHAVNYFDSGHGKGWWDATGVSIKHALCFEQVKPIGAISQCPRCCELFPRPF